ncbi:hypothetical protein BCR41DRAFT_343917 [Lobosporangium transversale]|uniref:Uncharacterized protein n=1 Tax=Lobosporangium transversale TaxID=64571 RepID=A0A1Y2H2D4_9FUNG|nr:hypothetical protein BCR41DRAFT_343917 [Lobosporangium transversale]ORZ28695.1 hypothetical protein BCR41DRAFT_343917 [Lobosporangium transversale]|eukprot:XP_021886368.1 hypothetical protein BCR41DRAFT_343917 [Lobosporangium transversale]
MSSTSPPNSHIQHSHHHFPHLQKSMPTLHYLSLIQQLLPHKQRLHNLLNLLPLDSMPLQSPFSIFSNSIVLHYHHLRQLNKRRKHGLFSSKDGNRLCRNFSNSKSMPKRRNDKKNWRSSKLEWSANIKEMSISKCIKKCTIAVIPTTTTTIIIVRTRTADAIGRGTPKIDDNSHCQLKPTTLTSCPAVHTII